MWKRRAEILAYFDTGASNGPVEAINGRLEHLRGIALGFRNLNHFHLAVTDPLRTAPEPDQRTLNPEGPLCDAPASGDGAASWSVPPSPHEARSRPVAPMSAAADRRNRRFIMC